MKVYNNKHIIIYFGDASDALYPKQLDHYRESKQTLLLSQPGKQLRACMPHAGNLYFAHQVHGVVGHVVTKDFVKQHTPWSLDGDYLLTNQQGIGIGVLTADCLPLILYDPINQSAAVIHAGWRGAVAGIAVKAAQHMQDVFGSQLDDLHVFMGPCAGRCCYRVGEELLAALPACGKKYVEKRDDGVYFDLARFNGELLMNYGLQEQSCNYQYHQCTICNRDYFSYRRQKVNAGRQMTVICLV